MLSTSVATKNCSRAVLRRGLRRQGNEAESIYRFSRNMLSAQPSSINSRTLSAVSTISSSTGSGFNDDQTRSTTIWSSSPSILKVDYSGMVRRRRQQYQRSGSVVDRHDDTAAASTLLRQYSSSTYHESSMRSVESSVAIQFNHVRDDDEDEDGESGEEEIQQHDYLHRRDIASVQTLRRRHHHQPHRSLSSHISASYDNNNMFSSVAKVQNKRYMSSSSSSPQPPPTANSTNNDKSAAPVKKKKKKKKSGSKYSTQATIPTPKSGGSSSSSSLSSLVDPKALAKTVVETTWWLTKAVVMFIAKLPYNTWFYATKPQERREKITEIKELAQKEFDHYKVGTKLLVADVRTARNLVGKTLHGSSLTRRERKQLLRTVSDLFRLVPFSMFVLIPLMEFALPLALKLFPNMLPSTFQDNLKAEENMKRELKSRIAMTQFFQETMEELAKQQKQIAAKRKDDQEEHDDESIASKQEACAADMLEFLDRARKGEPIPPEVIVQYANYFQDDLTLDNMPRMQLINMCKYMSIPPYGADSFLRFQLRHRIRLLKEDDQRIIWEGIDSLTKMELREACQERGMRSTGLSKEAYKRSLQQWLDLSVNKNVPISLLIMSRIFFLQDELIAPAATDDSKSVASLADAISGMDKEVLNDVILNVATSEERKSDLDVRKIQLEVLTHQNEKIMEEQLEREAAAKKKEMAEKTAEQAADTAEDKDTAQPLVPESITVSVNVDKMTEQELSDAIDQKVKEVKEEIVDKAAEEELGERELTPEEMEAISQLLSADPVLKEREDLERIKDAIADRIEQKKEESTNESEDYVSSLSTDENASDDVEAAAAIEKMEAAAAKEADTSTQFSTGGGQEGSSVHGDDTSDTSTEEEDDHVEEEEDEVEDPVVARLQKRIESMVDKIEGQLSDVHIKIGDKLHYLDKDMDGILSREEMAEVLSSVLKNITPEEALEIADEMDENKDGIFTVEELINWIETNQLVKYVDEGRDAEMDKIMESSHSSETNTKDNESTSTTESNK
mmetsp:Transcript_48627/g.117595  ORF Transcript_48627/g.117595 Transcript_48627/m.117595 type:complete len:1019 (+) Transcript_48627:289-3345(+)